LPNGGGLQYNGVQFRGYFGGGQPSPYQNPELNEVHRQTSPLSPFNLYRPRPVPSGRRLRYGNGTWGNPPAIYGWGYTIFPSGQAYFGFYAPEYRAGFTCISPYYFFGGAPFLYSQSVFQSPPTVVYVPDPVYAPSGRYQGWKHDDVDDYYLNRKAPEEEESKPAKKPADTLKEGAKEGGEENPTAPVILPERPVDRASKSLRRAWLQRDIQSLAEFVDKKTRIAVYLRGKYQYSLKPEDYLDLTRDAFQSTQTERFELDSPIRKEKGVYSVTGKHTYRTRKGELYTVYVSYAFEQKDDKFVLTQVGTSPERLE
jgi:hypothetical protein